MITGAASGIGRALAARCSEEGMSVVLADVDGPALEEAAVALGRSGAEVLAVPTDVSRAEEVERLADEAVRRFGAVDLAVNNAGVAFEGPVWEGRLEDWGWLLGVNLWGVIHGIRAFVPRMLRQERESHVVNTASIAGLVTPEALGAYAATKHAVVALSEALHLDLARRGAPIRVSVLCPGHVRTRIADAARNHPDPAVRDRARGDGGTSDALRRALETGMAAEDYAEAVLRAVREGRFYVLSHPEWEAAIRARAQAVLEGSAPPAAGPSGALEASPP